MLFNLLQTPSTLFLRQINLIYFWGLFRWDVAFSGMELCKNLHSNLLLRPYEERKTPWKHTALHAALEAWITAAVQILPVTDTCADSRETHYGNIFGNILRFLTSQPVWAPRDHIAYQEDQVLSISPKSGGMLYRKMVVLTLKRGHCRGSVSSGKLYLMVRI